MKPPFRGPLVKPPLQEVDFYFFGEEPMATLRELIIKISANSTSFQSEIARASRMGADYYKTMEQGGKKSAIANRQAQQALQDLNNEFASVKAVAAGATGALAGAFAVSSLIQTADNWGQLSSRIKMATNSADQYNLVQTRLMEISDRTYKPIEEQAELFIRSANAMNELGYSTELTLDFIDSISSALTINAASADKGTSAINALSKSMVLGKVSGGEWQTVMEVMPTVIGDVARHLGITETAVKKLASEGKLSMQTFSDALINAKNRNAELADSMPNTVADAMTKLSNHWKRYLGEANEANGATQVFVSGLNSVSGNLNELTTAGTALVGVGIARYLGNMSRSAGTATAALLSAKKEQIAFAVAQKEATTVAKAAAQADVYHAQQALAVSKTAEVRLAQEARITAAQTARTASQARLQAALTSGTAAEITRARAAVSRAQAALVAAKNADAQTLAEKRLTAAQARLERTRIAQSTAGANLSSATSAIGMAGRGVSSLIGLLGGIPGIIMLGAGAWYYSNQQTELARKSAQEYANQVDEITNKLQTMSVVEISESAGKIKISLEEQNRLVSEQEAKVRKLETSIKGYQQILANPGPVVGGVMINHLTSVESATEGLAEAQRNLSVEQAKLSEEQSKYSDLTSQLAEVTTTLDARLRKVGEENNKAYQSLIRMNGAQDLFNKLIGSGNTLLGERAGLVNVPMRLPQATVSDSDQARLIQKQRAAALAAVDGEARVKMQVRYDLEDMGRTGLDNSTYASQYEAAALAEYKSNQLSKPKKSGKTDAEKAFDVYSRLIDQQKEQIALSGTSTELERIKYQISSGELSNITAIQKAELSRNASAIDMLKTQERFKSLQKELLTPEEALLDLTKERMKLLKEAAPASDQYRESMERISKGSVQDAPQFSGVDASVSGPIGEVIKTAEAEKELEDWYQKQLEMQKNLLEEKIGYEEEYAKRVEEINTQHTKKLTDIQGAYAVSAMSSFAEITGSATDMAGKIYGESSGAYKALYLAQKAFAVGSIIMNAHIAAAKAPAELTILGGIPVGAALLASGYASAAMVGGMALAGMAHDGVDKVPETGTWLLQKGERVVTAQTSAKLDSKLDKAFQNKEGESLSSMSIGDIHIQNSFSGKPDDSTFAAIQQSQKSLVKQLKDEFTREIITPQGKFGIALRGYYARSRKE